jgi:hypothetical protein
MKIMSSLFVGAALLALCGCPASGSGGGTVVVGGGTTPPPHRPPPVVVTPPPFAHPVTWDKNGWELLGQASVDGKIDHDSIHVGGVEGFWDSLTLVVEDSDIELHSFVVTFANGEVWDAKLKHFFREGQRTRLVDLPGNKGKRKIKNIDITYGNLPGGGSATVQVWGHQATGKGTDMGGKPPKADEPPPTTNEPAFDPTGWVLLGSQAVNGKKDHDVIKVGKKFGKFDQVTIVVSDSDIDLDDFVVTFVNGETFDPKVKHTFKEGARSRAIDVPGKDRFIKTIELKYANLPGGGKATVQVYGRNIK